MEHSQIYISDKSSIQDIIIEFDKIYLPLKKDEVGFDDFRTKSIDEIEALIATAQKISSNGSTIEMVKELSYKDICTKLILTSKKPMTIWNTITSLFFRKK